MVKNINRLFVAAVTLVAAVCLCGAPAYAEEVDGGADVVAAAETTYDHSQTKTSEDVTLTISWDEPVAGQELVFHAAATGNAGTYKYYMSAPSYSDSGTGYESVIDPGRQTGFTDLCESADFTFTPMASGKYWFKFQVQDSTNLSLYLTQNIFIEINDANYPSVATIVSNLAEQCKADTTGSEYDMALWMHDWLIDNMDYDNSLTYSSSEAAFTRHTGTCAAYWSAYRRLCRAVGIYCGEDTYYTSGGRMTGNGHEWNAIRIDGQWYQVDCTWDDDNDATDYYNGLDKRHLYFCLTDELMAIAHSDHTATYTADGYGYRSTDLRGNYYVKNGKAFEWASAYVDRINEYIAAGETEFSVAVDNSGWPPSVRGIVNGITAYALNQMSWNVATFEAVSDNDNVQLTFKVSYEEEPEQDAYTVYYHASDSVDAVEQTTAVAYGTKTATLTPSALGFDSGKKFLGWKCYRSEDDTWWATDANGKGIWVALDNGELPSGYSYRLLASGWQTGWSAHSGEVHLYAQWDERVYTIEYHSSSVAEASGKTSTVNYAVPQQILSVSNLGFSNGTSSFKGWKAYRGQDGTWWAVDGKGNKSWVKANANGTLPEGYAYSLLSANWKSAYSATSGTVHLYAVWNKAYTVRYHESASAAAMDESTAVTCGAKSKTLTSTQLGFSSDKYFNGWRCWRDIDNKWWLKDANGKKDWHALNADGSLPVGYSYALLSGGWESAWSANSGDVHLFADWDNRSYTIYYHASDSADAVSETTKVNYAVKTKIKTASELGFSSTGKTFKGWKCHRDQDNKWWAVKGGKKDWVSQDANGNLPSGNTYALLSDGWESAHTATTGSAHLYAQWG